MEYELEADQDQESFAEMKIQKIYETKKKTNKQKNNLIFISYILPLVPTCTIIFINL